MNWVCTLLMAAWLCGCDRSGASNQADTGPHSSRDAALDAAPDDASTAADGGTDASDLDASDAAPGLDAADPTDAQTQDASEADAATPDAATPDSGPTEPPDAGPVVRPDGCPLDAPQAVNRVRIYPAAGDASDLVGARIQGSNVGPTSDFVDLATVATAPAEGTFTELTFVNTQLYRYVRWYAPSTTTGGLASIELYHDGVRVTGSAFGTASATGHPYGDALDADVATYFLAAASGGSYVGYDVGGAFIAQEPSISPTGLTSLDPVTVSLSATTPGAHIRYTLDGNNPSPSAGTEYAAPFVLTSGRISVRALTYANCYFDSSVASASYVLGPQTVPITRGLKTYHIGNSLTDTINPWLEPIADSTGRDHTYARWTIPGAPIKWLNEHKGEGFENPSGASSYDSFVQSYAPIDDLSLQPFSDPDFDGQGGAAVQLLTTAYAYSPQLQVWIYAQWPAITEDEWRDHDPFANGGGASYPGWTVPAAPTTWEDAARNHLLYHEAFRTWVTNHLASAPSKPLRIVPATLALIELKRQIEANLIPGMTNFRDTAFEDVLHLKPAAQYLVALVFYSCLYRETPEGHVTLTGGLTAQQALTFQRIAWSTASAYPLSGITP